MIPFSYLWPMQDNGHSLNEYVYSAEMVDFVSAANDLCGFLEELKGMESRPFIAESVRLLPLVYSAYLRLEPTEPVSGEEEIWEPTVTEQDWSALYRQIAVVLGPHNDFLRPADSGEFDRSDLVTHTVSEDLADIYQELRDFSVIYGRGVEPLTNDAVWELMVRFTEHWGEKLLRSLLALHLLYVREVDPGEEQV